MGICAYRSLRKQIDTYLKPMAAYPTNPAMQGIGCSKLLDLIREYEAPHVLIRLMGSKTTNIVCKCVKNHYHSGIVMRSAGSLLAELCKNERNLKRVRKAKVLHKLQASVAEMPHDEDIAKACASVEAALRGVYRPYETLEQAIEDGDSDLLILVMKTHPLDEEVQSRGSTGIVNMSREDEATRQVLCKRGAVPVLVTALQNFSNNNSVLANCANAFRELGRDPGANRAAGRDRAIEIMVKALVNTDLWKETHQALLWGLSRLTDVETNIIHMKAARLQYVLNEIGVRKEAVYRIASEKQKSFMRRQELAEARKKKEHRKEDEWEKANPHTSFRSIHADEDNKPDDEPQQSAYEEFKATIESGGALYNRDKKAPRKFLTEAEELAYIAKKKRLAQMVRDGSLAEQGETVVRGKKKKAPELQYELAGKAQHTALFVPQKLRNIDWSKYSLDGLKQDSKRNVLDEEEKKESFTVRGYEDTLDLLIGEKAAARRKEAKRRKNMRVVQNSEERNVVVHATRSGAYIG